MRGVSLLDRLKREGNQQRAVQEVVTRERDGRDALYKNEIEPRMKAVVTYLEALVATLNEVKPQVVVKMPIAGYGDLGAQPIWDFRIEHDRRYRNFVVGLDWTLKVDPERTPMVRAEGVTRIKTMTQAFHKFHLGGVKEEQRNKAGELLVAVFHARGHIKARMEAKISADDPTLRVVFSNASWLGSSQRQFAWTQIDEELCDRIARFIVREDDSLFTEVVQKLQREPVDREVADVANLMDLMTETVPATPERARPPIDAASTAVADIVSQLDPNAIRAEALTRLTEPDAPELPSLDELNAAFSATPVKKLEVLPLGVPGANPAGAERAQSPEPVALPTVAEEPVAPPSAPMRRHTDRASAVVATAAPTALPVAGASVAAAVETFGPTPEQSAADAIAPSEGPSNSPSLFMSRMSLTLKRLRDEEDGAK